MTWRVDQGQGPTFTLIAFSCGHKAVVARWAAVQVERLDDRYTRGRHRERRLGANTGLDADLVRKGEGVVEQRPGRIEDGVAGRHGCREGTGALLHRAAVAVAREQLWFVSLGHQAMHTPPARRQRQSPRWSWRSRPTGRAGCWHRPSGSCM